MRLVLLLVFFSALAGCATTRPAPPRTPWDQRLIELRRAGGWQLEGRAAVAVGTQGWQATLHWRQSGMIAEVNLSGPFGIGALALKQGPDGLSLNGAPPSEAVMAQLQDKLGFDFPLDNLHYWLLGIPNPAAAYELTRNAEDRAKTLSQAGWSVVYDRYLPVQGDVLPARLVLSREDVRVRIVIDRWDWPN
ncbi:MAG: outer rane lipoprotein LolB [Gammaproteobacteria bacterium]|jgi:outer membrane lipoprotein LolB|nr:outer rane lipoprotein LolB [Gammaproteobacteria bacterium]